MMVIVLLADAPLAVAVRVPVVATGTGRELKLKFAKVEFDGWVSTAGTVSAGFVLVSVTAAGDNPMAERETNPLPDVPPGAERTAFCAPPRNTLTGLASDATLTVPCWTTVPVAALSTTEAG